jgi:nucleoside 2-deoxyribosyltransferase
MKFYLAAAFSRKDEIAQKCRELEAVGHEVTCTWPWEDVPPTAGLQDVDCWAVSKKDIYEIDCADAIILFTQEPTKPFVRGGRMHEFGYAHGTGKHLIVCGPRENIFHYLPFVKVFDTWEDLLKGVACLIQN